MKSRDKRDTQEYVSKLLSVTGKAVALSAIILLAFSSIVIFFMFNGVISTEENTFESRVNVLIPSLRQSFRDRSKIGLKSRIKVLKNSKDVVYISLYDRSGDLISFYPTKLGKLSKEYAKDKAELGRGSTSELLKGKSNIGGREGLQIIELPSGLQVYRVVYSAFISGRKIGEIEVGFDKGGVFNKALNAIKIPVALSIVIVLVVGLMIHRALGFWQKRQSVAIARYIEANIEQFNTEFQGKIDDMKKSHDAESVEGGNFFNIMEAIRDISTATDMILFVRRTVLSSVRLFKSKLVSIYSFENGVWELKGRYSTKGYQSDIVEQLDLSEHPNVAKLAEQGSTDLISGYPAGTSQALFVSISSGDTKMLLVMQNKVGAFDFKDLLTGRIYAGFLPNIMAWYKSETTAT